MKSGLRINLYIIKTITIRLNLNPMRLEFFTCKKKFVFSKVIKTDLTVDMELNSYRPVRHRIF